MEVQSNELSRLRGIEERLQKALDQARECLKKAQEELPGGMSTAQELGQTFSILFFQERIKFIERILGIKQG